MPKPIALGLLCASAILLAILFTGCTDSPRPTPSAGDVPTPTVTALPGVTPAPTPASTTAPANTPIPIPTAAPTPSPTMAPTHTPSATPIPDARAYARAYTDTCSYTHACPPRLHPRPPVRRSSLWGWRLLRPVHAEMEPTIPPCRSPACWEATTSPSWRSDCAEIAYVQGTPGSRLCNPTASICVTSIDMSTAAVLRRAPPTGLRGLRMVRGWPLPSENSGSGDPYWARHIWVIEADGSNMVQLTSGPDWDNRPFLVTRWKPDSLPPKSSVTAVQPNSDRRP